MAKQTKSFLYGMLAGSIIGSVTALLFAPKPGKELRKDIADGAQQVGEQTVKIAGGVGRTTTKIAKQIGSGAAQIAGKARGKVHIWRFGEQDEAEAKEAVQEWSDLDTADTELTGEGGSDNRESESSDYRA